MTTHKRHNDPIRWHIFARYDAGNAPDGTWGRVYTERSREKALATARQYHAETGFATSMLRGRSIATHWAAAMPGELVTKLDIALLQAHAKRYNCKIRSEAVNTNEPPIVSKESEAT